MGAWLFKFLTIVSVVGSFHVAEAQQCAHRIFFLPQTHEADVMAGPQSDSANLDVVATSQLKVADFISRFPGVPVFSEQAAEKDYVWAGFPVEKRMALMQMTNSVFPAGLPSNPNLLSHAQKEKLKGNGGDFVEMMRGQLPVIHKVLASPEVKQQIMAPIQQWFQYNPGNNNYPANIGYLVYGAREIQALGQVSSFFKSNPGQRDAILIFGSNHNFNFYANHFPPECIIIPPEFRQDWSGRWRTGPEGFANQSYQQNYSGSFYGGVR
ncbi:MAG: hypothetical protein COT73_08080 [Bdellovibrio sp. CG10_big_fil_rev_8_21_14_0_10_47_8]|nr:MAG: hypothetical protein COT73_08080 [Bdellovibrio sp. CG10_big_fil_rev_8_21_14_0_10_47_8]